MIEETTRFFRQEFPGWMGWFFRFKWVARSYGFVERQWTRLSGLLAEVPLDIRRLETTLWWASLVLMVMLLVAYNMVQWGYKQKVSEDLQMIYAVCLASAIVGRRLHQHFTYDFDHSRIGHFLVGIWVANTVWMGFLAEFFEKPVPDGYLTAIVGIIFAAFANFTWKRELHRRHVAEGKVPPEATKPVPPPPPSALHPTPPPPLPKPKPSRPWMVRRKIKPRRGKRKRR